MEPLTIPPSPNWYETKIAVCTPDNTLIYGSNNSIIIIKAASQNQPSEISMISFAHLDRIHGLALAPTWNDQHCIIASTADDRLVKVWNLVDNTCVYSHKAHTTSKSRPVGVAFISDTKLVSVSEDGYIIVWKMTTNEFTPHKNLLGVKAHVTAISTCPHAAWLTAFGMKNGLVVVADLKGHGNVLYKLRAHEREVLDFSWCPNPTNVIPNFVCKKLPECDKETPKQENTEVIQIKEEVFNAKDTIDAKPANGTHIQCAMVSDTTHEDIGAITSEDSVVKDDIKEQNAQDSCASNSTGYTPKKKNPWANLKHADDDEIVQEPEPQVQEVLNTSDDFLKECLALKAKILETKSSDEDVNENCIDTPGITKTSERKILHATRAKRSDFTKVMDAAGDAFSPDVVSDCISDDTTVSEILTDENSGKADAIDAPKSEFLLASSARGGHIVVWRAGTDGRVQRRMKLPKSKTRSGFASRSQNNLWLSIHWISPEYLLSSGVSGELMVWDITNQSPRPKLIHNDHAKQLFCINSPFCHERNTYSNFEDLATWTIGQDRSILFTMLQSRKVLACYPTFSCPVMSSAASPIAATRLAFGLNDGFVRVWDLSKENKQYIQMSQIKTKVGGKVMSLAWHTNQEYLLAFGTEDGQVGFINSGQMKKPPVYFVQHFLTSIHKLEWAPVPNKPSGKHSLYCCAEGQLAVYDFDNTLEKPEILKMPQGERVTNFAWKSDYSKLAIGCKSGTVYILDANYNVKTTLYYQKKAIVSMAWHPMQTAEDDELSPNHDWLASATGSDNTVVIFDLSKVTDDLCMKEVIAGELLGHVKPVNQVFWSPYKNGVIASASEDGTVTIWNQMKPISTFLNNNAEPILTVMWSPLHEDMIISAGRDCSVRIWDLKGHPTKEQNDLAETRSARKKNLTNYKSHKEEINVEVNKSKRVPLLGEISGRQANLEMATADCRVLFEYYSKDTSADNLVLKLFSNSSDITEIVDAQKDAHRKKGKHAMANHLQLWTGDIGETVKKAIVDGNLTPWLINIAPAVSYSLWQEAVEAYAIQLADSPISDPVEIASYYLSLHKVDEAIDILNAKQAHRDALVLAKLKKPENIELHKQILLQWATTCMMSGRFEIAAQSFMAHGQFEEAAKVLYRRSDSPTLALAIDLAHFSGNATLASTIQYRYDTLMAQMEDKVPLPLSSRLELVLAKAQHASLPASADRASSDDDGTDKPCDSGGYNVNANSDIQVEDHRNGAEKKTTETDKTEVDEARIKLEGDAKCDVIDDVSHKNTSGMGPTIDINCTEQSPNSN